MKKTNKSQNNVWSNVSGRDNVLEEVKHGKKTGRVAELINLKVSEQNKIAAYNEYINNHKNIIVMYNSESFEPFLYKIKGK